MANTNLTCYRTDYWGYDTATYADDFAPLITILNNDPKAQPTILKIWSDQRIDAMQVFYGAVSLPKHDGGTGGTPHDVNLLPDNPIRSIQFWGTKSQQTLRLGKIVIGLADGTTSYSFGNEPNIPL